MRVLVKSTLALLLPLFLVSEVQAQSVEGQNYSYEELRGELKPMTHLKRKLKLDGKEITVAGLFKETRESDLGSYGYYLVGGLLPTKNGGPMGMPDALRTMKVDCKVDPKLDPTSGDQLLDLEQGDPVAFIGTVDISDTLHSKLYGYITLEDCTIKRR